MASMNRPSATSTAHRPRNHGDRATELRRVAVQLAAVDLQLLFRLLQRGSTTVLHTELTSAASVDHSVASTSRSPLAIAVV
jgi:hypothetical protein